MLIKGALDRGVVTKLNCGHYATEEDSHIRSDERLVEILASDNPELSTPLTNPILELLSNEFSLLIRADRAEQEVVYPENRGYIDERTISKYIQRPISRKVQTFSEEIGSALNNYENETRRKQQEFINQLLRGEESVLNSSQEDLESLQLKVQEYRDRIDDLNKAGIPATLVDTVDLTSLDLAATGWVIRNLVNSFITSFDEQMREKVELAKLLIAFLENAIPTKEFKFINSKFEISSKSTDEKILPEHLSSGEQQLFILGYEILSKCNSDSLVLIDEPELSMDPLMKSTFVDFLDRASELRNSSVIPPKIKGI